MSEPATSFVQLAHAPAGFAAACGCGDDAAYRFTVGPLVGPFLCEACLVRLVAGRTGRGGR